MKELQTRYGVLRGVTQISYTSTGDPESLLVNEPNMLHLPMASWVPLHYVEDHGRRRETPILFHSNGVVKSLPLQGATKVSTSVGSVSAELVTFYETGEIRRIFPTAGKLSGYWTEEQEYELAPECELTWNGATLKAKVINLHFYRSGALQSITFWPKERVSIPFQGALLKVRSGISFFLSGAVKSYEPAEPTLVDTPIGKIMAYDSHPLGVTADVNSLQFDSEGVVVAVSTLSTRVRVFPAESLPAEFTPYKVQSFCEEADTELRPLQMAFRDGFVHFKGLTKETFSLTGTQFETVQVSVRVPSACCSG